MTRVRIAPPDTEEDVSAEQVAAYLLARWWRELPGVRVIRWFQREGVSSIRLRDSAASIERAIHDTARAEKRHPSAVLADIVGPARAASVGARCDDGPRRCYYARSYRPCTTEDITAAVVAAWPDIAAAVGYVGEDPFPLVDGWMGVGFSVRLFGSGEREGTANQFAARVAMDALMVSLVRAGFAVSHDGNEWQEGRLILGWARPDDSAAHGAGESEEQKR